MCKDKNGQKKHNPACGLTLATGLRAGEKCGPCVWNEKFDTYIQTCELLKNFTGIRGCTPSKAGQVN